MTQAILQQLIYPSILNSSSVQLTVNSQHTLFHMIVINSQHVRAMPPTPSPSLVSRPHFFTSVRKTDCSTSPFFVQVHRNACVLLFLKLTLNIIEDYTFYTVCYNNLLIKDVERAIVAPSWRLSCSKNDDEFFQNFDFSIEVTKIVF